MLTGAGQPSKVPVGLSRLFRCTSPYHAANPAQEQSPWPFRLARMILTASVVRPSRAATLASVQATYLGSMQFAGASKKSATVLRAELCHEGFILWSSRR